MAHDLDTKKLAAQLGDVLFAVRTGTAGAQEVAETAVKHLMAAGWRPLTGPAGTAPEAARESFRVAMLANTKGIRWHGGVDAVWSLAVQHGRKLAAADVHSYGTAICTELGVWSGRRNATGDAVGRAWADAEAIAAQGPVGAGQRLVRDVNLLIADLDGDLDENDALAARDDAVGRAWRAAQRGVVLDDPNEDDGAGHVHEFAGGFACQTCPHVRPEDGPETEVHVCDPDADGHCLYCREVIDRG